MVKKRRNGGKPCRKGTTPDMDRQIAQLEQKVVLAFSRVKRHMNALDKASKTLRRLKAQREELRQLDAQAAADRKAARAAKRDNMRAADHLPADFMMPGPEIQL